MISLMLTLPKARKIQALSVMALMCWSLLVCAFLVFVGPPTEPEVVTAFMVVWIAATAVMAISTWAILVLRKGSP